MVKIIIDQMINQKKCLSSAPHFCLFRFSGKSYATWNLVSNLPGRWRPYYTFPCDGHMERLILHSMQHEILTTGGKYASRHGYHYTVVVALYKNKLQNWYWTIWSGYQGMVIIALYEIVKYFWTLGTQLFHALIFFISLH